MLRTVMASTLPLALAVTPAPRWGHQAVYVPSQQTMYVVGGEVEAFGTQVTNEVLVLPLNTTNPSFTTGVNDDLPPHAFAAMSLTKDESSLVVLGGMTSACSTDSLTHTFDLTSGSWAPATPSRVVRRRGAGMAWVDNGSTNGEMMLIGGIADSYSCATSTHSYPAADVLSLPMASTSLVSSRELPASLTGSELAVADFAMTSSPDGKIYLAGGQSANGDLVSLGSIGVWSNNAGWTSRSTSGDVPEGRVGASLVAHPSLDLLILHGGAILDTATDSDTPTTLLAFLNTTTWAWSTPSNLQPPASSAASYHSSVMTTSGVMITAFGLGSDGSPRSDVFYLDMRDPTGSSWSWKSYWNKQMLGAYAGTSNTVTTGTSATNGVAATNNSSAPSKKGITTIVVPVIIGLLLALPVIIYFIRRRVRIARKRRLARHFSFSSQEDNGGFSSSLEQFRASRKTKTLFSFGRDANEKDSSLITDIGSGLVSILKRYSGAASSVDGASSRRDRSSKGSKMSEKAMNWEEIDFGLGQVDERRVSATSRRSSFSAPAQSPRTATKTLEPLPFAMPVASTAPGYDPSALFSSSHENMVGPLVVTVNDAFPRVGTPRHDGQMPLVPELAVIPPRAAAQALSTAYPTMAPSPAQADGLDWSMLQQELDAKPVFRSISATSTLRSHAHPRSSSPTSARTVTPPSLPSLEFQRDASQTSSITLVNPKTGRRVSDSLPFSQSPRSVSQPLAGRQLAGNLGRRGSAPFVGNISPSSSGSVTPTGRRASTASVDPVMRRTSNRSVIVTPGSPMLGSKRESTQSRLRVVNVTDDEVAGQAL